MFAHIFAASTRELIITTTNTSPINVVHVDILQVDIIS